jgi:hypothetical protein
MIVTVLGAHPHAESDPRQAQTRASQRAVVASKGVGAAASNRKATTTARFKKRSEEEKIVADELVPVNWYAVVGTGSYSIQPYLDTFELLADPQLLPFEQDGRKLGKLVYSGFAGYEDYEGVLNEARELISVLSGTMRVTSDPEPLSILNIVGVFEDGAVKQFPPRGRAVRGIIRFLRLGKIPGERPQPTTEQYIVEYIMGSGDRLVKDVLNYLTNSPDFFGLFKILEVIRWDLGKGDLGKGYQLVLQRGWVSKARLDDFIFTAHKAYRHWDDKRPGPKMDLQEARIMFRRIIEEWIAERAGLQLPPVNLRPGWHP